MCPSCNAAMAGAADDDFGARVRNTHLLRSAVDPHCHLPCHVTVL